MANAVQFKCFSKQKSAVQANAYRVTRLSTKSNLSDYIGLPVSQSILRLLSFLLPIIKTKTNRTVEIFSSALNI